MDIDRKTFYTIYLQAAKRAICESKSLDSFSVLGPSYYVKEEEQHIIAVEDKFYGDSPELFDAVALYLDAVDHGFEKIEDIDVEEYKLQTIDLIDKYEKLYAVV